MSEKAQSGQPLRTVRALAAGLAGTAAMTAYQLLVKKLRGERLDTPVPERWEDAPPPAQVARKLLGDRVTRAQVPLLTNALHWLYGTGLALLYPRSLRPLAAGPAFGTAVWAASYAELVPLGVQEPPWKYPPGELALDLSYHLVYGAGVAAAYAALE